MTTSYLSYPATARRHEEMVAAEPRTGRRLPARAWLALGLRWSRIAVESFREKAQDRYLDAMMRWSRAISRAQPVLIRCSDATHTRMKLTKSLVGYSPKFDAESQLVTIEMTCPRCRGRVSVTPEELLAYSRPIGIVRAVIDVESST